MNRWKHKESSYFSINVICFITQDLLLFSLLPVPFVFAYNVIVTLSVTFDKYEHKTLGYLKNSPSPSRRRLHQFLVNLSASQGSLWNVLKNSVNIKKTQIQIKLGGSHSVSGKNSVPKAGDHKAFDVLCTAGCFSCTEGCGRTINLDWSYRGEVIFSTRGPCAAPIKALLWIASLIPFSQAHKKHLFSFGCKIAVIQAAKLAWNMTLYACVCICVCVCVCVYECLCVSTLGRAHLTWAHCMPQNRRVHKLLLIGATVIARWNEHRLSTC